ncbi:hypothetical protein MTR67_004505 [Solanum verrucosum]|uniref:Uncharacterized protein n=1 Tax=Solanum verrucosum TaxID=315347 RepID=A0AAF0PWC1_SOLVR|nr:uncharacterized protein LOC125820076 [Solanum verrucosum]WMV11120.1 hypothetical protein MTR67_004505 [Solanum verrucosum]
MNSRNRKSELEEVEELLRAAEDDVSLKLSLNSHMARGSSTQFIDPDLDQRFQALRSKQTPPKKPISQKGLVNQPPSATSPTDESDDLLTRFASLKSSLPSYSSASSSAKQHAVVEDEEDDDDEVEKVIKWAIDAARLDPSPPSGTDDDDENTTDEEDEGENSDDDFNRGHRKAKRK